MFIRSDRRFDLRLLHVKLFVHWRVCALLSCLKMRIFRKCGFAGRPAWKFSRIATLFFFRLSARLRTQPFSQIFSDELANFLADPPPLRKSFEGLTPPVCENSASLPWFRTVDCRPLLWSCLNPMGPVSSHTRQRFLLLPVRCLAQIDTLFYRLLHWYSLSSCYLVAAFEVWVLAVFWKINLDQTAVEFTRITLPPAG